jgi:urea carboxylase
MVGNDESAAALEIAVNGPTLRFDCDTVVALTGAECESSIPRWRRWK